MEEKRVIITNLACTSDLCSLVEYDIQVLRDLIDNMEVGWVESQTMDPKSCRDCR
ncbi:MAG: hypothetical protein BWY01_00942 [Synergistetes bacterium ADurb.Bin155]|jgi:hypothetical protein|nr:hypothetical protein [Synergistales bacterium]MBP8995313.1 hypothetical protein [Synergistales bacterium]NMD18143.1 hypothetical protein [Synergistaceae bacterium]OQB45869.1 MAG: hypothetical protein BWY01_00942 [Synergistetes bacterium ADurb.Bin155]HOC82892.1 hypothetical protein [Synergistales bacterium]